MPSCAIITCKARSQDCSVGKGGVSFHRFPKDPAIKEQWINATGRDKWFPTKYSTICSAHFSEDDYDVKASAKKFLLEVAIPHKNIVTIHSVARRSISPVDEIDSELNEAESPKYCINEDGRKIINCIKFEARESVSPVNEIDSELNEAESPKYCINEEGRKIVNRIKFEDSEDEVPSTSETQTVNPNSEEKSQISSDESSIRKLKHIITCRDIVIKRQRKQLKTLQQQNCRLNRKVLTLEDKIKRHENALKNKNLHVI